MTTRQPSHPNTPSAAAPNIASNSSTARVGGAGGAGHTSGGSWAGGAGVVTRSVANYPSISPIAAMMDALCGTEEFEELWRALDWQTADRMLSILAEHINQGGNIDLLHELVESSGETLSTYQLTTLARRLDDEALDQLAERWESVEARMAKELPPSQWGKRLSVRFLDKRRQIQAVLENEEIRLLNLTRLLTLKPGDTFTSDEYAKIKTGLYEALAWAENWVALTYANHPAALAIALEEAGSFGWGSGSDEEVALTWFADTTPEQASEYGLWVPKPGSDDRRWADRIYAEAQQTGLENYLDRRIRIVVDEALDQITDWENRWGRELGDAKDDLADALTSLGPDFWQETWEAVLDSDWQEAKDATAWREANPQGASLDIWQAAPWEAYEHITRVSNPEAADWLIGGALAAYRGEGTAFGRMRPAWYSRAINITTKLDPLVELYRYEQNSPWAGTVARRIVELAGPERAAHILPADHFLRNHEASEWFKQQVTTQRIDKHLILSLGRDFKGTAAALLACCDDAEAGAA